MSDAIEKLENTDSPKSQTYGSFIRYKAIFLTLTHQYEKAVQLCKDELSELTSDELAQFFDKLKQYHISAQSSSEACSSSAKSTFHGIKPVKSSSGFRMGRS